MRSFPNSVNQFSKQKKGSSQDSTISSHLKTDSYIIDLALVTKNSEGDRVRISTIALFLADFLLLYLAH